MMEVPIIKKPVQWFSEQTMDWFLYDRDLRHEIGKTAIFKTTFLKYSGTTIIDLLRPRNNNHQEAEAYLVASWISMV